MTKLICIILLLMVGCKGDKNESDRLGNSRIEMIHDLPYRNLQISDSLVSVIKIDINKILGLADNLDNLRLFYLSDKGELKEIGKNWNSVQELIDNSYELWRTYQVSETIITYPSSSQSVTTGQKTKVYVIEIENQRLTGTCRMFFNESRPKKLTNLTYTERN